MNRYGQLSFTDYSEAPLPQLPVEQLDAVLGQFQQQKDVTDALAEQDFEHLANEKDAAFANEVRSEIGQLKDELVSLAEEGDVDAYMSALKKAQVGLLKMRAPGGKIHALASRKQQYADTVKEIKEMYKDAPPEFVQAKIGMINITDVQNEDGSYNPLGSPMIGKYHDISEEIFRDFKDFAEHKYSWVTGKNGQFLEKHSTTTVTEERLREAMTEYLSNPKYRDQLMTEMSLYGKIDPSTATQFVISKELAGKTIKEQQQFLIEQGYDIQADGKMGPETSQALMDYGFKKSQEEGYFSEQEQNAIKMQSVLESYMIPAIKKYTKHEYDVDIKTNDWTLFAYKERMKKMEAFTNLITTGASVEQEKPKATDVLEESLMIEAQIENHQKDVQLLVDRLNAGVTYRRNEQTGKVEEVTMTKDEIAETQEQLKLKNAEIDKLRSDHAKYNGMIATAETQARESIEEYVNFEKLSFNNKDRENFMRTLFEETIDMSFKERSAYIDAKIEQEYRRNKSENPSDNPIFKGGFIMQSGAAYTGDPSTTVYTRNPSTRPIKKEVTGDTINEFKTKLKEDINNAHSKYQNKKRQSLQNIIDSQEPISPKILSFGSSDEGQKLADLAEEAVKVSAVHVYNSQGLVTEVTQDKKNKVISNGAIAKGFTITGYVSSGIAGKDNVVVGYTEDGEQYYLSLEGSNLDEIYGAHLQEYSANPDISSMGVILQNKKAKANYMSYASMPNNTMAYSNHNGMNFVVTRLPGDEYTFEDEAGNKGKAYSAIDLTYQIEAYSSSEEAQGIDIPLEPYEQSSFAPGNRLVSGKKFGTHNRLPYSNSELYYPSVRTPIYGVYDESSYPLPYGMGAPRQEGENYKQGFAERDDIHMVTVNGNGERELFIFENANGEYLDAKKVEKYKRIYQEFLDLSPEVNARVENEKVRGFYGGEKATTLTLPQLQKIEKIVNEAKAQQAQQNQQ